MIRIADYIVKYLEEYGIKHIFMISGGGAMHLNDAIGKSKKIKYICNHHEQACAIAAEGYARVTNKLAVVNVTSGPGGTNTMTGVIGQWLDSVPVLYISGQVKFETTIKSCPEIGLRQLGDQEINITDIVKPVTKYSVMLTNPDDVRAELDKAIFFATSGRPGPVWIDVPLNVQGAMIDETQLPGWLPDIPIKSVLNESLVDQTIKLIESSERPIVIAGHGIRIANAQQQFLKLIEKLNIPVVTTFNGFDLIPSEHKNYIGRIGTLGTRPGNFALQNADLIICIGTRNNIRQVSYSWQSYARAAKKIIVDIDGTELNKPTIKPDIAINASALDFINNLNSKSGLLKVNRFDEWCDWCTIRKNKYPVVLPGYKTDDKINPYFFIETLTKKMSEGSICVAGNGTACVALFQAGIVKNNQRLFWNSGCASMGYDIPAALGASVASGKEVICLAGDGSAMMNIQELQTIAYNKLPVKIFLLNNDGYISIKQTQHSFFGGNMVATDKNSGVGFPDFIKVAEAFGLKTEKISNSNEMDFKIDKTLSAEGSILCEVILDQDYIFQPKLSSEKKPDGRMISKPLEDLYPFLSREEFLSNMIVKPINED
ncbi:MAG TPA: hypothetical protein DD381_08825 [Lentisphaeria bacterium]|nr:MAG: hypothetical protein A2X47_08030 [Lentisphaerae bacterium GWF2_38_69]HBM16426.1 hypothetical protein [Lentisphaeria bacterium]